MERRTRSTYAKGSMLAVAIGVAVVGLPQVAASQARGTLQVNATVVDTRASFAGLQAANAAASDWASSRTEISNDVSTVAQIQVSQATGDLVIRIDYLKN
jgi:hypothetical protein